MGFQAIEALTEADYILNACGRRIAPDGARAVDLPYSATFHSSQFATVPPATPTQGRLANNSKATFVIRGVVIQSPLGVRIRWPNGRYLQQGPTWAGAVPNALGNPAGTGGNLLALDSEVIMERGSKISVEMSGGVAGVVNVQFVGVLRYLVMSKGGGAIPTTSDPVAELQSRPRYLCGPPQNIMAPEWFLGNQCTPETPDGFEDEPYTFFSPSITVAVGSRVFGTQILIPGSDDVVVKRVRMISDYSDLDGSAVPVFAMRLPNGYALTGGDMVPGLPLFWWPWLPSTKIPYGQRLIVDVADILGSGEGSITSKFEFDAVKRRRVS